MQKRTVSPVLVLLAISCSAQAQETNPQPIAKSCRTFVQGFYDWYVPKWLTNDLHSDSLFKRWQASRDPLKQTRYPLSAELVRRLKEDRSAQAKAKGDITGLDFDPYIGGNAGPVGRYVVGKITHRVGHCFAGVYVHPGGDRTKPIVEPEAAFDNGRWVIVNFHFYIYRQGKPDKFDLLSTLKELREQRRKASKSAGNNQKEH
jgi:hypothetical protein